MRIKRKAVVLAKALTYIDRGVFRGALDKQALVLHGGFLKAFEYL